MTESCCTVSLRELHMQPDPETLQKIHGWIKQLGLDKVGSERDQVSLPPSLTPHSHTHTHTHTHTHLQLSDN